jgi:hypothetical protein
MTDRAPQDDTERAWIEGNRAAWRRMLLEALRALGHGIDGASSDDLARKIAALVEEIEDARRALRDVCAEHGDTNWGDGLYLADVIEKHLGRHLDA